MSHSLVALPSNPFKLTWLSALEGGAAPADAGAVGPAIPPAAAVGVCLPSDPGVDVRDTGFPLPIPDAPFAHALVAGG